MEIYKPFADPRVGGRLGATAGCSLVRLEHASNDSLYYSRGRLQRPERREITVILDGPGILRRVESELRWNQRKRLQSQAAEFGQMMRSFTLEKIVVVCKEVLCAEPRQKSSHAVYVRDATR